MVRSLCFRCSGPTRQTPDRQFHIPFGRSLLGTTAWYAPQRYHSLRRAYTVSGLQFRLHARKIMREATLYELIWSNCISERLAGKEIKLQSHYFVLFFNSFNGIASSAKDGKFNNALPVRNWILNEKHYRYCCFIGHQARWNWNYKSII